MRSGRRAELASSGGDEAVAAGLELPGNGPFRPRPQQKEWIRLISMSAARERRRERHSLPPRQPVSSARTRVSALAPRQTRTRPRRTTLSPAQAEPTTSVYSQPDVGVAPTLHSEQMPAPKPFAAPKAPVPKRGGGRSREVVAAVIQLSLVGVGLLLGALWYAHQHRNTAPKLKNAPIRSSESKKPAQEPEDFSSRSMREITQAVSFLSGRRSTRESKPKGRSDFSKKLSEYKVPTFGVQRVREASEKRSGSWTYRSLRYHSDRSMQELRSAYEGHFKKAGYRVRASTLGRLGSGGFELLGQRGADRMSAKFRLDVERETVRIVLHERVEGR